MPILCNGTGLISVGQSHIRDNQDVTNSLCHTVKGNKKCLWQQTEVRLKNAFHIVNKSLNRPEMTPRNHPKWQALWFYQSLFIFSDFFTESWFSRNWIRAKFQTQGLSITLYKLTYNWLAHSFNELNCQQKIRAFTAFLHSLVKWRKRRLWTKGGTCRSKTRSPEGHRYPEGDPFGNNTSVGSLFWVSICSSLACFLGSGRKEELGKMEEPGLNFCRARFAIVLWTCCDLFSTFLPLAVNQHLIAACQCQNKSHAHFVLQIIAIF